MQTLHTRFDLPCFPSLRMPAGATCGAFARTYLSIPSAATAIKARGTSVPPYLPLPLPLLEALAFIDLDGRNTGEGLRRGVGRAAL